MCRSKTAWLFARRGEQCISSLLGLTLPPASRSNADHIAALRPRPSFVTRRRFPTTHADDDMTTPTFHGQRTSVRHAAATGSGPRRVAAVRVRRKPRYRLFHQIVGLLHELLPARLPIDVRLSAGDGRRYGDCTLEPSRFRIRVSSRLPDEFAIEVLIHEWAHALSWPRGQKRCSYRWQPMAIRGPIDHDAAWGRAYAKVYCKVLFEILPQLQKARRAAQGGKRKGRCK